MYLNKLQETPLKDVHERKSLLDTYCIQLIEQPQGSTLLPTSIRLTMSCRGPKWALLTILNYWPLEELTFVTVPVDPLNSTFTLTI